MTVMRGRNQLGFCALALGGLFLCNPVVGFCDVLPDLVGYLLLYVGLWRLSDLCDDFSDAMRLFRNLIWVSAGQIALYWIIYDFLPALTKETAGNLDTVNEYESPMLVLLASFAWAFLTWYYLIPAFRHLFAGFGVLARRCDGCAIQAESRRRTMWERMSKRSVLLAVFLPLLALLPELSILTTLNLKSSKPIVDFDWYRFITLFRTVAAIAAGVIGILWFLSYLRFFVKVLRDTPFCEDVHARYEAEILPRTKWLTYRRVSLAVVLITVGLLFVANVRIDGHPVFHKAICVALLCVGAFVLERPTRRAMAALLGSGLALAVVSHVHWVRLNAYLADHALEEALHIPRAYEKFFVIRCLEFAEWILTLVFLSVFAVLLWRAICRLDGQMNGAIFGKDRKTYLTKLCVVLALALAMTVLGCANAILQLDVKFLWWIALALFAAMLLVLRSLMTDVKDEIFSCAREEKMNKSQEKQAY